MSRFDRCIDFVLLEEGGLSNHRQDPGGLTQFGISQRRHPRLDIRRLTVADAKTIYRRDFWDRIQGDRLPVGVDLVVLDMAVNAGVVRAVRLLQQVTWVADDRLIGSLNLAAIQQGSVERPRYGVDDWRKDRLAVKPIIPIPVKR